jgi:hypothetical protein
MSTFNKDAYLKDYRNRTRLIQFGTAFQRRIPKKYHQMVIPLLHAYPRLGETHVLETTTWLLGLIWDRPTEEIPRLLRLMMARSGEEITYSIGEVQPNGGSPVRITFTFPELIEEEAAWQNKMRMFNSRIAGKKGTSSSES